MTDDPSKELWRQEWREYRSYAEELFKGFVARANEVIRQLAFAGIAVVWVFRETISATQFKLAPELRWAAIFFLVTLVLDFAYYVVGFFTANSRIDEIKRQDQEAVRAGKAWPSDPLGPPPDIPEGGVKFLFIAKVFVLIAGAGLLLFYLAFRL